MPTARTRDWTDTQLWKLLKCRAEADLQSEAAEFLPNLTIRMRALEAILRQGGTSPLDFTLHDADHSFRVAERLWQLVTPENRENLSDAELALLLLAAYGHDVGMTPERNNVLAHHRHLFGYETNLTEEEKSRFLSFLDEYPAGKSFVLPLGTSLEDLNLADEITIFYVRDRHKDWSADWIWQQLAGPGFEWIPDFLGLLIRLCYSPHWDFNRLKKEDFDPILIGNGNKPAHIHPFAHLKENLFRIPCRFEFKTDGIPGNQVHWQLSCGLSEDCESGPRREPLNLTRKNQILRSNAI